jgi:hypothetical protein
LRSLITIPFSEDLIDAALKQAESPCTFIFPTQVSAETARQRFQPLWDLQDCEFYSMADFKDALLLPDLPSLGDDKRLLLLFQAMTREDREYFHTDTYFDIVEWGNHFFQFFEELCDECIDAGRIGLVLERSGVNLLAWQEEYLRRTLEIRLRYEGLLNRLGYTDPIFHHRAENISVPFSGRKVIFANQYYYSKLEKVILDTLEESGNPLLIITQASQQDADPQNLELPELILGDLTDSCYRTRSLEIIECENEEQMVLAFLARHSPANNAPQGSAVIVDSHFNQKHYKDLFDPSQYKYSLAQSLSRTNIYKLILVLHGHLAAMSATIGQAFLPVRQVMDACSQEGIVMYHLGSLEGQGGIMAELQYLLDHDILYIDNDLQLLDRLGRKQGFPALEPFLKAHFALLDKLSRVDGVTALLNLIDVSGGLEVAKACSEEELLHSDVLEVFYERLVNFASLEAMGLTLPWQEVFGTEGIALAASILKLFLESISSGRVHYHKHANSQPVYDVSNLLDLRNLSYDKVVFFHAIEGEVPSNPSPVWLLNEFQRARIGLKSYADLRQRERYFFFRSILSSSEAVIFTYRNMEKDIEPGSFVTELVQAYADGQLGSIGLRSLTVSPRVSHLYQARARLLARDAIGTGSLPADERCRDLKNDPDSLFVIPSDPATDLGPDRTVVASYYSLAGLIKNPFIWYVRHLRRLPVLDLRPKETISRKLFGSIMHDFLSQVLQPLAAEGVDLNGLRQAFIDKEVLGGVLADLLIKPEKLYLYKIPQNYNHEFLVSVISANLVESINAFFRDYLEYRLKGLGFNLIPEQERMTDYERAGKELILVSRADGDYRLRIRGKADLRIECPGTYYIIDFKTGGKDDDQLIFYEWLYYLLDPDWQSCLLTSVFWMLFKQEAESKPHDDKKRQAWRSKVEEAFTASLASGYRLGRKAGDREELRAISRADLYLRSRGGEA